MRASKDARVDACATLDAATRRSKKMRETSVRDGVARVGRSTAMGRSRGRARGAAGTKTSDDDCDID
jgi:hypothetical protein